jgi:hypothetical protein
MDAVCSGIPMILRICLSTATGDRPPGERCRGVRLN